MFADVHHKASPGARKSDRNGASNAAAGTRHEDYSLLKVRPSVGFSHGIRPPQ